MTDTYDVVVIGGGAAEENAAGRVSIGGLSAVLVESELVGGECSYWACMPSKALLRPGEILNAVRRVPGAPEAVVGTIDTKQALLRRDALAANCDDQGQVKWVKSTNADLIRGHGRLAGERTVRVEATDGSVRTLKARVAVVVATGSGAAMPPIEGLAEARPWDSRDITSAQEVPGRLIILGGGAVGLEMAQAWRTLGSKEVTVVEAQERLLPNEEPFAGEEVAKAFSEMGIKVITSVKMVKVERGEGGSITATLEDGDEILVAVGRRPLTRDIGLETVGLEPGKYIRVDDQLRAAEVDGGWLYAIGDVNGRSLLTHMGKYQARLAGDHILGMEVEAWPITRRSPGSSSPTLMWRPSA